MGLLHYLSGCHCHHQTVNANASNALGSNWYNAAPYVMPLANTPPNLPAVMSATGAKAFTLAFVLANGGCTPAWTGDAGMDNVSSDTQVAAIISSIRSAGGDVVVSFGGYGGTKLGESLRKCFGHRCG